MPLNGTMALILRYFAEFGSLRGPLRKSGFLAINRFSPEKVIKDTNYAQRTRCALRGSELLFSI